MPRFFRFMSGAVLLALVLTSCSPQDSSQDGGPESRTVGQSFDGALQVLVKRFWDAQLFGDHAWLDRAIVGTTDVTQNQLF